MTRRTRWRTRTGSTLGLELHDHRQALIPSSLQAAPSGFRSLPLSAPLLRALDAAGFTEPRPIQRAALPHALAGRDVLGLAQTGTGKTAAFALPILERLVARGARPKPAPRALPAPTSLVVAPTRELAAQIHDEFTRLGKYTPLKSAVIFGGVGQGQQERALAQHPDVVVACPGRLLDLLDQKLLSLGSVETLVLDEADHMFDMGFLPSLRKIVAKLPRKRQNLLFSATMPRELRKLADEVLHRPEVIELGNTRPPETIEHVLHTVVEGEKMALLEALLAEDGFRSAIVFTRTKHRAKRLAQQLERKGHRAVALQGNLSQGQRERAMGGFRSGAYDVLVATDIAARGIDVAAVSHVINFDLPTTAEAYTHRIGRTGRAELDGKAASFATADDMAMVRAIEKLLGAPLPRANDSRDARPARERTERPARERTERPARERTERPARERAERPARNGAAQPARASGERTERAARPARDHHDGAGRRARPASDERRRRERHAPDARTAPAQGRPQVAPRPAARDDAGPAAFGAGL